MHPSEIHSAACDCDFSFEGDKWNSHVQHSRGPACAKALREWERAEDLHDMHERESARLEHEGELARDALSDPLGSRQRDCFPKDYAGGSRKAATVARTGTTPARPR